MSRIKYLLSAFGVGAILLFSGAPFVFASTGYTASGAGTTSANGQYCLVGSNLTNGTDFMYPGTGGNSGLKFIGNTPGDQITDYYYGSGGYTGFWNVDNGNSPAPTVATSTCPDPTPPSGWFGNPTDPSAYFASISPYSIGATQAFLPLSRLIIGIIIGVIVVALIIRLLISGAHKATKSKRRFRK